MGETKSVTPSEKNRNILCGVRAQTCHLAGGVVTAAAVIVLVLGCVLIMVYQPPSPAYYGGMAVMCVGCLLALATSLYVCAALRQRWRLFGRIEVKPKRASGRPDRPASSIGGFRHSVVTESAVTNSAYASERATEWDPETVLAD